MSRLIDADAVMDRMKQAYEDMGVDTHGIWNKQLAEIFKAEETDMEDIRLCLHKILGAVAQSPTIDAVSVVHGEWRGEHKMLDMPRYEWYRCSECNFLLRSVVNYCPNCGAKMDGGKDQ